MTGMHCHSPSQSVIEWARDRRASRSQGDWQSMSDMLLAKIKWFFNHSGDTIANRTTTSATAEEEAEAESHGRSTWSSMQAKPRLQVGWIALPCPLQFDVIRLASWAQGISLLLYNVLLWLYQFFFSCCCRWQCNGSSRSNHRTYSVGPTKRGFNWMRSERGNRKSLLLLSGQ